MFQGPVMALGDKYVSSLCTQTCAPGTGENLRGLFG